MRKVADHLLILLAAIASQALVPLNTILFTQLIGVKT